MPAVFQCHFVSFGIRGNSCFSTYEYNTQSKHRRRPLEESWLLDVTYKKRVTLKQDYSLLLTEDAYVLLKENRLTDHREVACRVQQFRSKSYCFLPSNHRGCQPSIHVLFEKRRQPAPGPVSNLFSTGAVS